MSLYLSTLHPIYPVYSNNLNLTASGSTAVSTHYYQFKLFINGNVVDTFNYFANPLTFDAEIHLSPLLSTYMESQVYFPTGNSVHEIIPNSVIPYYIQVKQFNASNVQIESGTTSTRYIFNGCFNAQDEQLMTDYLITGTGTGNFLTNWHTGRHIMLDDLAFLNVITGNYGGNYISIYSGVTITRHQTNGSSSAVTFSYNNTSKNIVVIDISPMAINDTYDNFINADTKYYCVDEINGKNKTTMSINLIEEHKLDKFYNFIYVNRLGGQDFFTATKVSNDSYDIRKSVLNQFTTEKVYYTNVDESITVLTQPLTSSQAKGLKELFMSPAVKVYLSGKYNDIRIINTSVVVPERYPKTDLIQFVITFKFNHKYYVQQF